jgi:hypothetical protein
MAQLLLTLIVPPIVGLITYVVVRRAWQQEEDAPAPSEAVSRSEPSMTEKREEIAATDAAQTP